MKASSEEAGVIPNIRRSIAGREAASRNHGKKKYRCERDMLNYAQD